MAEPQLSVRSAKAIELAHRLREKTGRNIGELVEEALSDYELKLLREARLAVEEFWGPIEVSMAKGRALAVKAGATSDHSDLYDDYGLPA